MYLCQEIVKTMLTVKKDDESQFIVFCTQNGLVKRTNLKEFENIRSNGKIAITLKENDELISVNKTTGENEIVIGASNGRLVRFKEDEIRVMGRTASGVRGINLNDADCVGLEIVTLDDNILIVTRNGYGKKTLVNEFRTTKRGSKGVKALNITDKNGPLVAFKIIEGEQDLMIITNSGMIIRLSIEQISQLGRVTQGVRLINLKDGQFVSSAAIIDSVEEESVDVENENVEHQVEEE